MEEEYEQKNDQKYLYLGILAGFFAVVLGVALLGDVVGVEDNSPTEIQNETRDTVTLVGNSESHMSGGEWVRFGDRKDVSHQNHDCRGHNECSNADSYSGDDSTYNIQKIYCYYYSCNNRGYRNYRDNYDPRYDRDGEVLGWGEKRYLRAQRENYYRERDHYYREYHRNYDTVDCDWWNTGYRRLAMAGWYGADEFYCWN